MTDSLKEELTALLAPFQQEHVLKFWDTLTPEQQQLLAADIRNVDLQDQKVQFNRAMLTSPVRKLDDVMNPVPAELVGVLDKASAEDRAAWKTKGLELVGAGKCAVILLAGGQGTRLGSPDPKGMFNLELPTDDTLFSLQAKRILALQSLAQKQMGGGAAAAASAIVPWYIMTSGATFDKTVAYFKANAYFGIDPANVTFFRQNQIPSTTFDGEMILKTPYQLARNPDGNGGLYGALKSNKIVDDIRARGVEHVHVYCVDNVLVRMADPIFMGFCATKGVPAGNMVVGKSSPTEKVGVVCLVEGKYQVVEYSEISEETAHKRNEDGTLTFNAGNICNHYFTTNFLEESCDRQAELKQHVARKKIPCLDEAGQPVKPSEANGIKLEKFVFDNFCFASELGVLELARADCFSPLKNAAGAAAGTVVHCRADLYARNRAFLVAAGATFVDAAGSTLEPASLGEEHVCFISPSVSLEGEGLEEYVKANPRLTFPIVLKDSAAATVLPPAAKRPKEAE